MNVSGYLLYKFIEQNMAEMGFKKFHFEPISVEVSSTLAEFKAYGEYWYFFNTNCSENFTIQSTNSFYEKTTTQSNLYFNQVRQFTELIEITKDTQATHVFEFIRVIPEIIEENTNEQ